MLFADLAVLCTSAVAAFIDVRSHRIPNALTAALGIIGAIAATASGGPRSFVAFAGILIALLAVGTLLHGNGLIGGGDVKLIAVSAATLGMHDAPVFLTATVLTGGVLAIAIAARMRTLRTTLSNLQAFALPAFAGVRPLPIASGTKMPYALAIFGGALVVTLLHIPR